MRGRRGVPAGSHFELQVMDLGLDFKSYATFVDARNAPLLGNVISFPCDKIADTFEPTVGLLVTLLHLYNQSSTGAEAKEWLSVYETVQQLCLQQVTAIDDKRSECARYAHEAVKAIRAHESSASPSPSSKLHEKLLIFLDAQSGLRGGQSPSQRKVPREPKGAFCNLHLSDHKCNQEFCCNQLHLHQATTVKHRMDFHSRMIDVLKERGLAENEIFHRLKDSIFFAKYGNRVTVRYQRGWIPFFKTAYSPSRLDHAFRTDTQAPVVVQDERNLTFLKQTDLPNPREVAAEIELEAKEVFEYHQRLTVPAALVQSPTSDRWATTVREFVREAGIGEHPADESLLKTLESAGRAPTPTSSDSFTPLMKELNVMHQKNFEGDA